jgi:hypothetical protein
MGANMLEAENTLDALVEDEMEQYIIETAKQSILGLNLTPVNLTGLVCSSGQALLSLRYSSYFSK